MTFWDLAPGDVVTRMLAGTIPVEMTITEVTETTIICKVPGFPPDAEGWTFDRSSGVEIDIELGWGPEFGATGSFLVLPED